MELNVVLLINDETSWFAYHLFNFPELYTLNQTMSSKTARNCFRQYFDQLALPLYQREVISKRAILNVTVNNRNG